MSSSPTFIVSQTKGVQEEKVLAIDQGRSHTSSPRTRPNSRLEMLMIDIARSAEQKLDGLARSTNRKLEELARGQADLAYAQIGQVAELANIMGRISSVEKSLQGTPSPSPIPGRRGSPSSAETMHVSVPSTTGYLVFA